MAIKPTPIPPTPIPPTLSGNEFGDVYTYASKLNTFFKSLIEYIQKLVASQQPTPVAGPIIRCGTGRIEHNRYDSRASVDPAIEGNYAVVITERRNEAANGIKLFNLYVMNTQKDKFQIGHDQYTGAGDAPSYAWIAMKL